MSESKRPTKAELCALAGISGTEFDKIADAANVAIGDGERGEITEDVWMETVKHLLLEEAQPDAKKKGRKR